ncbi:MAG: DUF6206 family protein [Pseudomonadota bacterium]
MLSIEPDLLARFEQGLDPLRPEASEVPARVLGYGEISTIFQVGEDESVVYKRMPLFGSREAAGTYETQYHEYCGLMQEAGLLLPESATAVVTVPGRPVVLYIAQTRYPADRLGHKLLHHLDAAGFSALVENVVAETARVWAFNRERGPGVQIAIDGQISNWVLPQGAGRAVYLDTSTPIFRKHGQEQLDPELFLKNTPSFLRWLARMFFLDEVMTRYYDPRRVAVDLAANLYKEQRPELVAPALSVINRVLPAGEEGISEREAASYYRLDRTIWSSYLALRRLDRFLTTRVFHQRYEFILPGRIRR